MWPRDQEGREAAEAGDRLRDPAPWQRDRERIQDAAEHGRDALRLGMDGSVVGVDAGRQTHRRERSDGAGMVAEARQPAREGAGDRDQRLDSVEEESEARALGEVAHLENGADPHEEDEDSHRNQQPLAKDGNRLEMIGGTEDSQTGVGVDGHP
jgi:hypothetical protein